MRKMEELLSQQFRRYDLDRELMRRTEADEQAAQTRLPVITISRDMGAGGVTTGQLVATALGFTYYDREILEEIARQTGSDRDHIARYDEGARDVVSSMMLSILDSRHVADSVYLRSLYRVIKAVGTRGRAVVIGRGAGCILREALKVRLVAPFELRVQRMAMVRDITEKEAESVVLASDHAKRRFLRHFFACNPNEPLLYDLVINTGTLSLDHAAELIVARARHTWKEA